MRRRDYADPALIYERRESAGCKGCRHASTIFGLPACDAGKRPGRRCKQYSERKAMTLEERLENWGRVVRDPRFKAGTCALWAQWYVAIRDHGNSEPPAHITRDERDAWDVERAWSKMTNEPNKTALKAWYVENMDPGALQTTMWRKHGARVRRDLIGFVLQNAHRDISTELIRLLPVVSNRNFSESSCKPEELAL